MRYRVLRVVRRWACAIPVAIILVWLILLNRFAPPPRPMDGAQPSPEDRARILGADDRFAVADPTVMPFRPIGQVRAWWGTQGLTGTGVLVGPDQVLTAAHCVCRAELGGWAHEATFTPARTGESMPYGTARVVRYAVPAEYVQQLSEAHDVVLMTLDRPIGNDAGWLPVLSRARVGPDLMNAPVRSAGYPSDNPGRMVAVSGSITAMPGTPGAAWEIDLDAISGQSGSPIWIDASADGSAALAAILVAELDNGRANLAAPVSAELVEQLRAGYVAGEQIAAAANGAAGVLVAEPGSASSPLVAPPIAGCGAGVMPMAVLTFAGLVIVRSGVRRNGMPAEAERALGRPRGFASRRV